MNKKMHRYNLTVSGELFDELRQTAERRDTTVLHLLQQFIKLGLIALKVEDTPDAMLIIREGEREREVILL